MKKIILLFATLASILFYFAAQSATQNFVLKSTTTGVEKKFSWKGQALLSCPREAKACLAEKLAGTFKPDLLKYDSAGANPTDRVCNLVDGELSTHKDVSESEFSICMLKDGSAILSWSLIAQK